MLKEFLYFGFWINIISMSSEIRPSHEDKKYKGRRRNVSTNKNIYDSKNETDVNSILISAEELNRYLIRMKNSRNNQKTSPSRMLLKQTINAEHIGSENQVPLALGEMVIDSILIPLQILLKHKLKQRSVAALNGSEHAIIVIAKRISQPLKSIITHRDQQMTIVSRTGILKPIIENSIQRILFTQASRHNPYLEYCLGKSPGLYGATAYLCRSFYYCNPQMLLQYFAWCPIGTLFDENYQVCNFQHKVDISTCRS